MRSLDQIAADLRMLLDGDGVSIQVQTRHRAGCSAAKSGWRGCDCGLVRRIVIQPDPTATRRAATSVSVVSRQWGS